MGEPPPPYPIRPRGNSPSPDPASDCPETEENPTSAHSPGFRYRFRQNSSPRRPNPPARPDPPGDLQGKPHIRKRALVGNSTPHGSEINPSPEYPYREFPPPGSLLPENPGRRRKSYDVKESATCLPIKSPLSSRGTRIRFACAFRQMAPIRRMGSSASSVPRAPSTVGAPIRSVWRSPPISGADPSTSTTSGESYTVR